MRGALVLAAAGAIVTLAPSAVTAAPTPATVPGKLPGVRVALTREARRAGAVEIRRVIVTRSGTHRLALLVGRTHDRRLCVGAGRFFRCLDRIDAQPVYAIGNFSGKAGTGTPQWGAVVGLVAPEVSYVDVEVQFGVRRLLTLQRLPGFPWRAFAYSPTPRHRGLPYRVDLGAGRGSRRLTIDMAWALSRCTAQSACIGRAWSVLGDSVDAPIGEERGQMVRAKQLALGDPRVRRIIGSGPRIVAAPDVWSSCGGAPIGAYVTVELFRRVRFTGQLPFVAFGAAKRGRAYAEGVARLRLGGVTRVHVGVDLARGRVISIDPSGDYVRTLERHVVKAPTPAGGLDAKACPSTG